MQVLIGSYSAKVVLLLPIPELFVPVLDDADCRRWSLCLDFDGHDHHESLVVDSEVSFGARGAAPACTTARSHRASPSRTGRRCTALQELCIVGWQLRCVRPASSGVIRARTQAG